MADNNDLQNSFAHEYVSIPQFYKIKNILITGGTTFLGKVFNI